MYSPHMARLGAEPSDQYRPDQLSLKISKYGDIDIQHCQYTEHSLEMIGLVFVRGAVRGI